MDVGLLNVLVISEHFALPLLLQLREVLEWLGVILVLRIMSCMADRELILLQWFLSCKPLDIIRYMYACQRLQYFKIYTIGATSADLHICLITMASPGNAGKVIFLKVLRTLCRRSCISVLLFPGYLVGEGVGDERPKNQFRLLTNRHATGVWLIKPLFLHCGIEINALH